MNENGRGAVNPNIINQIQELPPGISKDTPQSSNQILSDIQLMRRRQQFGRVSSYPESLVMVPKSSSPDMVHTAITLIVDPSAAKGETVRKRRQDRLGALQSLGFTLDEQGVIQDPFGHGRVGELEFGWLQSDKDKNVYIVEIWFTEGLPTRREYLVRAENYASVFKAVSEIKKLLVR